MTLVTTRSVLPPSGLSLAFSTVPILLSRGSNQAGVAQAGLIGSLIHLLACSVIGGALIIFKPLRLEPAFVYWLLGLYWLTLFVLAAGYVRAVKSAPIARQS